MNGLIFGDNNMDPDNGMENMDSSVAVAWSLCRNIRTARIMTVRPRDIEAFLRYPGENLRSLHLRFYHERANLTHVMNLIPERTGFLEDLDLSVEITPYPNFYHPLEGFGMNVGRNIVAFNTLAAAADKIVKSNQSLKSVSFSSRLLGPLKDNISSREE